MGVGLHLQSLKNGEVSTGYYVISGVDPGMAAQDSRGTLVGIHRQGIRGDNARSQVRHVSPFGVTQSDSPFSVVKYKLEGVFGKAVEVCFCTTAPEFCIIFNFQVCFWSADAATIELQQLQTAVSDFPYAAFAVGALLLLLSIVYLKLQFRPKPSAEAEPIAEHHSVSRTSPAGVIQVLLMKVFLCLI